MKKEKIKPIKLGSIIDGQLKNFSDSVTWDLESNILIFIRDSLKRFNIIKRGVPVVLSLNSPDEYAAMNTWTAIIDTICTNLDYYLKDTLDYLTQSDYKLYKQYLDTIEDNAQKSDTIIAIENQLETIIETQYQKLSEAIDLLKEWWGDFWW